MELVNLSAEKESDQKKNYIRQHTKQGKELWGKNTSTEAQILKDVIIVYESSRTLLSHNNLQFVLIRDGNQLDPPQRDQISVTYRVLQSRLGFSAY